MRRALARPIGATFATALAVSGLAVTAQSAAAADAATITSAGPLTSITVTPDLNCAVNHRDDVEGEWYSDLACGTFVAVGANLFGPATIPAGIAATGSEGYVPFTPVSQALSGAGTSASPYTITTVVTLGATGITLTQTDTYVVGHESYRTDIALTSAAGDTVSGIVYRGGDCYLQNSDQGLGGVLNGNAPVCKAQPTAVDPNRVEGFQPLTTGATYIEANYSSVWRAIATRGPLPNTYVDREIDNGIAIAWPFSIGPAATQLFSSLAFFSPTGHTPVTLTKSVNATTVAPSATVTYTITATNSGAVAEELTSISDLLPAGFTYVPGSTTGATTADPTSDGASLTWTGPFALAANGESGPGTVTLQFSARVPADIGVYPNSVTATCAGDCTVVGAFNTAPVAVRVPDLPAGPVPAQGPAPRTNKVVQSG